jgi:hypothetical protein
MIDVPAQLAQFATLRRFPMHGALLLFDRDTGLNVLCKGPETSALSRAQALRPVAPRVVQFGITNPTAGRRGVAHSVSGRGFDDA